MYAKGINRRNLIRLSAGATAVLGVASLTGCGETQVVEVVKEVPVEKIVTQVVEKAVIQEKVVTQIVEKLVTVAPVKAKAAIGEVTWIVRSSPVENPWQESIVEPAMKKLHPELKVTRLVTPIADYLPKFTTLLGAGTPPDIFTSYGAGFPHFWAIGATAPVDEFMKRDGIGTDVFLPHVEKAIKGMYTRKGQVHGLPNLTTHGTYLFYNMKLFEEAGVQPPSVDWNDKSWNWDAMVERAKKLTKNPGKPDAVYGVVDSLRPYATCYLFGGDLFYKEQYEIGIHPVSKWEDPKAHAGLQARADLMWKEKVMPTQADMAAIAQLGDPFKTGRVAMSMTGGWGWWSLQDITAFKWGAAAVPGRESNRVEAFVDPLMMANKSKNPDGAWALLKYLVTQDGQLTYSATTKTPPVLSSLYDSWVAGVAKNMAIPDIRKVVEGANAAADLGASHRFIGFNEIWKLATQEWDKIWLNEASAEKVSLAAKPQMDKLVKQIYDEFAPKIGLK